MQCAVVAFALRKLEYSSFQLKHRRYGNFCCRDIHQNVERDKSAVTHSCNSAHSAQHAAQLNVNNFFFSGFVDMVNNNL